MCKLLATVFGACPGPINISRWEAELHTAERIANKPTAGVPRKGETMWPGRLSRRWQPGSDGHLLSPELDQVCTFSCLHLLSCGVQRLFPISHWLFSYAVAMGGAGERVLDAALQVAGGVSWQVCGELASNWRQLRPHVTELWSLQLLPPYLI